MLIPIGEGVIDARAIRGELSELSPGEGQGRRDDSEITFFKSVGLPFEDNVTGWHGSTGGRSPRGGKADGV